jgi:pimeloyl-ACP methyl ester carboxylesterase
VTVAYDHRGSGLSLCEAGSITFDHLVSDALAVLDAFGIDRCVLAAESAGAQTALAVPARFPSRVSHLVIVDGMYSRGVAVDADPFLQGLRLAYPATFERFVQLCVPEPGSEHIKAWGRKVLARADASAAIAATLPDAELWFWKAAGMCPRSHSRRRLPMPCEASCKDVRRRPHRPLRHARVHGCGWQACLGLVCRA